MSKDRLEAFSDGVIAIIITVMVLDLRTPQGGDPAALRPLAPIFLSYILSFVNLGIYWNNHHHLFQAVEHVNGAVLWANLHLLFWLSLFPFATAWMGENNFATWPVALYGANLLLAGVAYFVLVRALLAVHGSDSTLRAEPWAATSRAASPSCSMCWRSRRRFSTPGSPVGSTCSSQPCGSSPTRASRDACPRRAAAVTG